mgnify:CR=1 FL=1
MKVKMEFPKTDNYRMAEGLNQLRINLSFCGKDINTIMVVSTREGEGKSSVAFSLARTLSETEKRTILVDCDLRKSVMLSKRHIQGLDKGLSHYLSGQAEMNDIIYSTEKPNFFLVPSGPHTLDPTNLLDTNIFKDFIKDLKRQYDYIIIDTPPLGLVMDAVVIGQCADGAVFVIEQGKTKRKMAQNVVKQLKRSNIRVFGAVLNKVDEKSGEYRDYNYSYTDKENKKGRGLR